MKQVKLMQGDNMESLKKLPDNSIDSVVTDPPYGLSAPKNSGKTSKGGFMNKRWDYDVPSVDFWKEVYRVLKPGGHILSFGGTRTYHRMVVNIEDAGFEIRDQIMWLYGSGFPKSLNVGKAVDKLQGNEREVIGNNPNHRKTAGLLELGFQDGKESSTITKGTSPYEGWGTALKPANEPICLARKPLSEKSVAENVLKWKTGGINVDGCRVGFLNENDKESAKPGSLNATGKNSMFGLKSGNEQNQEGRFPANIILECICDEVIKGERGEIKKTNRQRTLGDNCYGDFKEQSVDGIDNYNDKGDIHTNLNCPCRLLDEQSGIVNQGHWSKSKTTGFGEFGGGQNNYEGVGPKDKTKGGASRFFYQAKVSKAERNMGLDEFEEKDSKKIAFPEKDYVGSDGSIRTNKHNTTKNNHPTVKPINLMTYLCRLITPENGIVLDPFMGSGSTGVAAQLEGFRFVEMEMDNDYFKIAEARINSYEKYRKFLK